MNQMTPPDRRPQNRAVADTENARAAEARRAAEKRKHERRKEAKKARVQLIIVVAAVLASIALFTVLIISAVRKNAPSTEAQGAVATSGQGRETVEAIAEQTEIEPTAAAPVEYASASDTTRKLTEKEIGSEHAIMIDLSTNEVIMSREGDAKIYPASMTKIMTLIVAYEHAGDLEDTFTMTADILSPLWQENATVAGFSDGEEVRLDDLMYGLILPSGADCAIALAIKTAGSEAAFADMMNEKVAELGLKGTHFKNPTGLHDDDQYSTCHDIALILEYAIRDDFMREVLSTYEYTSHPTEQHPEGLLVRSTVQERLYGNEAPGMFILGGKTGYTDEALNCLATFAVKYDMGTESEEDVKKKTPEYILVTAKGNGKWVPVFDAINLYALVVDDKALETRQYPGGKN